MVYIRVCQLAQYCVWSFAQEIFMSFSETKQLQYPQATQEENKWETTQLSQPINTNSQLPHSPQYKIAYSACTFSTRTEYPIHSPVHVPSTAVHGFPPWFSANSSKCAVRISVFTFEARSAASNAAKGR
jgi:hypothetical protein